MKREQPVRCRKCGRRNRETANFCSHCGATLQTDTIPRGQGTSFRGRIALLSLLVAVAALLSLWRLSPDPSPRDQGRKPADPSIHDPSAGEREPSRARHSEAGRADPWRTAAGEVTIAHHLGLELARIPAMVLSERWIALPVSVCYGGDRWRFAGGAERPIPIVNGFWRDGDPVALWQLEKDEALPGPELSPWQPGRPLAWRSLVSGTRRTDPGTRVEERSERFTFVAREGIPGEPGVYVQDGHVVGWTFGPFLDRGALWNGPPGGELSSVIRVDHFYSLTFASGREERFLVALSMEESAPAQKLLKAFAEGFRYQPELEPAQTPPALKPEEIARRMRGLTVDLLEKGFAREVADLFDMEIVGAAGDPELAVQWLRATELYYGRPAAIDLAEALLDAPISRGPGFPLVRDHAKALSTGWIRDRIDQGDTLGGWRAYKRADRLFPHDPDIRLLGVEIALNDGDWRTAEGLLPVRGVPADLTERAARLRAEAARLKAEEGKIVIRFQPGLRRIPVRAMLNGRFEQEFVIDTGASLVTIPSRTAEELGLRVDGATPERWVSTAGGPVLAKEITLASIELDGRAVKDVRAWILDIPGNPKTGLLGLNYLDRFHVEIDNARGVLMLKPR